MKKGAMMFPAFNKESCIKKLSALDVFSQRAFGLLCCERLVPNYVAFQRDENWGDSTPLRQSLDLIWKSLDGLTISPDKIQKLIDDCEFAAPSSDDFDSLRVTSAQDACFAVCSLLDHLTNSDSERIAQIATFATDSIDLFVQETENMKASDPNLEKMILEHSLMQRELANQDNDIKRINQVLAAGGKLSSLFQDSTLGNL